MKTKFFTRDGDRGESGIGNNKKKKNDPLFDILGELDLLNSWLGLSKSRVSGRKELGDPISVSREMRRIQETLFVSQAEIAAMGFETNSPKTVIGDDHVKFLEDIVLRVDKQVPELKQFVIPGGDEVSASLDVARALSRRVERLVVAEADRYDVSPEMLQYLNRLSSALFALSRYVNHVAGVKEESPTYRID